ncbi:aromatic ring-hydroxylating dioxygenase subunit alpha [Kamptonema formosum]|uniref:aromatic ring-hydroxylating dioxygenase subunit alpha n=1 Tax=Kamptonema formosum TaxID=331992 RepID=UPI00035ED3B7|nr:Rieske 2Fe-2S domain-containing protein [Oscillatoria sp. PCC 10802]
MKTEAKTEETAKQTESAPVPERERGFNWRLCWYPVAFVQDLPKDRAYRFSLYDEPFVLFRNRDGKLGCLTDRCSHRAARLSDGQITDGKIECLYHGWQFGTGGECEHIPQLPVDAKIPANACVRSFTVVERQGMVWVWPGEPEAADEARIPIIPELDKPEFHSADYMRDLPYDQTYFIENVIDPAHVFISHHGTEGNREQAQPLEMEVLESSVEGIKGRWRGMRNPNGRWNNLDFTAPNLVMYSFGVAGRYGGIALYSIPLGQGKCRMLLRRYANFLSWKIQLKPLWLEHLRQNKILEQDLQVVVGQKAELERLRQPLKELYWPLKTSDTLVIEYRKWLDKFGQGLPYYQGYATSKLGSDSGECGGEPVLLDRLSQHTQLCGTCSRAYRVTSRLQQISVGAAVAIAALAIVADGFGSKIVAVSAFVSAAALAAVAEKVKTHFERSYTRH